MPRRAKTYEEHIRDGTYRPDRHSHLKPANLRLSPPPKPGSIIVASAKSQRRWIQGVNDEKAIRAGYRFNEALAEHVVKCIEGYLCHSQGEWNGQPFTLLPWQKEKLIYPLFGWVGEDGRRRFRITYCEIPKKQGKSALASALGLYGLIFDEEAGAEIYSLGSDKDQAKIVHGEAINMVKASEQLKEALTINNTTSQITYERTNSFYKALAGTPRGKQGIKAHFAIADELHEWKGDEVWNALRYAFRMRRSPLMFVITNAGDDLNSVCKRQRDKADGVLNGTIEDHRFFPLVYSCTNEEADEEIRSVKEGATELPIARRCNPSLGVITREDDLVADIKDAITTPSEIPNLKRFTYSVWATGQSPWLDMDRWRDCKLSVGHVKWDDGWQYHPGSAVDLSGETCWAGLDLSHSKDFTAFTMVFPADEENTYHVLPMFWLPVATAEKQINLAPYHEWAQNGFLRLLDGEVINYRQVEQDILDITKQFDVQEIMFDPWRGEPMRQALEEEYEIPCVKFHQQASRFAGPTDDFERFVKMGTLHHSDHPVLSWQAQHTEVKIDANNNKRPVKRTEGDYRTIDGVVAGIMALFGAMTGEPESTDNWYEENEVEFV